MQIYAVFVVVVIVPVALLVFRSLPSAETALGSGLSEPAIGAPVLGLKPGTALGLLSLASFLCCVPMAMPQGHLVAFCSDLGIPLTQGSAMLSVLLACAFAGRQFWGFVADRYGGLRAILAGSTCQAAAMIGFLLTQNEAGLFVVSAGFGLGFSGIIPAYVIAIRELFRRAKRRGEYRRCCCAAAPVWRRVVGWPAPFMISSASTPPLLPPVSYSIWPTSS